MASPPSSISTAPATDFHFAVPSKPCKKKVDSLTPQLQQLSKRYKKFSDLARAWHAEKQAGIDATLPERKKDDHLKYIDDLSSLSKIILIPGGGEKTVINYPTFWALVAREKFGYVSASHDQLDPKKREELEAFPSQSTQKQQNSQQNAKLQLCEKCLALHEDGEFHVCNLKSKLWLNDCEDQQHSNSYPSSSSSSSTVPLIPISQVRSATPLKERDLTIIHDMEDLDGLSIDVAIQYAEERLQVQKKVTEERYEKLKQLIKNDPLNQRMKKCGGLPLGMSLCNSFNATSSSRLYLEMNHWKYVSERLCEGVCDKKPDFNVLKSVELPPSWTISADGRPDAKAKIEQVDFAAEDDSVCSVCFDGESGENNPIVFCDRCDIAIHQACYGVQDIPEGDYFCDACVYVMKMESKLKEKKAKCYGQKQSILERVQSTVKCALCPTTGGALKRTVCGKWAHLTCALWHPDVRIVDIVKMGPIELPLQVTNLRTKQKIRGPPCFVCKSSKGKTLQCCHPGCSRHYHPICAWFAGFYCSVNFASNADCQYGVSNFPKDEGNNNFFYDGRPVESKSNSNQLGWIRGGLSFQMFCPSHTPADAVSNGRSLAEQKRIRGKYKSFGPAAVDDNSQNSPASKHSKRKNVEVGNKTFALPIDDYPDGVCAICFSGSHHPNDMVFCSSCGISAHKACFTNKANNNISDQNWQCQVCQSRNSNVKNVECVLCPRRGGAFQLVDGSKNQWSHFTCATWIPGAIITKDNTVIVNKISKTRKDKHCYICNERKGFVVQCQHESCFRTFHPLCSFVDKSSGTWITYRGKRNGEILQEYFCNKHPPTGYRFDLDKLQWIAKPAHPDVVKMRYLWGQLNRARQLCDMVARREKLKRRRLTSTHDIFETTRCFVYNEPRDPTARKLRDRRGSSSSSSSSALHSFAPSTALDCGYPPSPSLSSSLPSVISKVPVNKLNGLSMKGTAPPRSQKQLYCDWMCNLLVTELEKSLEDDGTATLHPFLSLPDANEYPEYYLEVAKPIAMDSIKRGVDTMAYQSIGELENHFRRMFNNARMFNKPTSRIVSCANRLERLLDAVMERTKEMKKQRKKEMKDERQIQAEARAKLAEKKALKNKNKKRKRNDDSYDDFDCGGCLVCLKNTFQSQMLICDCCDGEYHYKCLPKPLDAVPQGDFWCSMCIHSYGNRLVERRIKVWWDDDKTFYSGTIDAFVKSLGYHRISYDDGEWEIIDLAAHKIILHEGKEEENEVENELEKLKLQYKSIFGSKPRGKMANNVDWILGKIKNTK
eukprot:g3536.t1